MANFGFIFPGQGSQSVSMIEELIIKYPHIEQTLLNASEVVSIDLLSLIRQGPKEQLNLTQNTQPALLAVSVALFNHWLEESETLPSIIAGHSLGEYSALVCAGVINFQDAVSIVHQRGLLMSQAVPSGTGLMAAILGLDDESVRKACSVAAENQIVSAVNYNSPGQVVIAGEVDAVNRAIEVCKSLGAKRAMPLAVSVPSHCELMRSAAEQLSTILDKTEFREPTIQVINNVDVSIETQSLTIKDALIRQLFSPVRWTETIQAINKLDIYNLVECGPGKVLTGLNKRINKQITSYLTNNDANFNKTLEALN